MPRYAAFLRGVMPTNAKMPQLKAAFEAAGFTDVRTLLASGNVVFSAPAASVAALERKAEAAMQEQLGQAFLTIVRPISGLRKLLESNPYKGVRLSPVSKRIITFLRGRPSKLVKLPIAFEGVRIVAMQEGAIFSAYEPNPKGPVFMTLLQKTFGKEQTTRTWDTVAKAAK
jgi:uncharacterized protein (DUF1697 family)